MACRGNNNKEEEVFRCMKRERPNAVAADEEEEEHQDSNIRRIIRSEFFKLKSLINEKKDDLMNTASDKFDSILHDFDKLDEQVKKPQEQIVDAEALLDLTRTLVGSVNSMVNEGVTPSQFVSSLLKHYAHPPNTSIDWQKLGIFVSPIFLTVHGSSTMLDPMESQLKRRKAIVL
ncbi:non-structural maintenance of chromosomes element 4 homolog A [Medicago truncatula]|nr:non-structural maintenance of chromosomes element 4 homolog A [Medicago truncatula]KEH17118.1 Nse4, component of Smc5/6 DNA repair complex protein [Medicago truncatula]